jgi:hypothetical protein
MSAGATKSEFVFRQSFGLWKALEAQKKTTEAEQTKKRFEAAWKGPKDQLRIEDF